MDKPSEKSNKIRVQDDTELFEIMMFQLSPILGGRTEVMNASFMECLKYIELKNKQVVSDRWNNFMDMVYATQQVDKTKRQKYIEMIQPKQARKQLEQKTNLDQLRSLKEGQGNVPEDIQTGG